jgi:anti-sigma B factor antagonist
VEPDEADGREARAGGPVPGTVALERPAPAVAVVTLRGEHDLTTRAAIDNALTRAGDESHVLVDLSECTFIDSTVIGALVRAFQSFGERGRRLELTIPPDAKAIQRVAKVAGLTTFLAIHETRDAGLESISAT